MFLYTKPPRSHTQWFITNKIWEMICLQHFYNIFTTNLKWQVVIGYYC